MKLFVLLPRIPYPLEKGDKLRAFHQIQHLSKSHEIYLCALSDTEIHPQAQEVLSRFCKEIRFIKLSKTGIIFNVVAFGLRGLPLQCGYFYQKSAQRKITEYIQECQPDHIYAQLIRVGEYVKKTPIEKTLDYQDVLSKGIFRRIDFSGFWMRCILKTEYRRLLRYEKNIAPYFDHKTIITAVDRELLPVTDKTSVQIVPNGVDFNTFKKNNSHKQFDLILSGNMSYPPNVLAARFLAHEVLPKIWKHRPQTSLVLCGANPCAEVKALANKNIFVTGWVTEISDYYGQSEIFIAPMQIGTGLQNKILEAMAMQLPCVCSSLAAKPLLNLNPQQHLKICETAEDYAETVLEWLENPSLANNFGEAGYHYVKSNYSWEKSNELLEAVISDVLS